MRLRSDLYYRYIRFYLGTQAARVIRRMFFYIEIRGYGELRG